MRRTTWPSDTQSGSWKQRRIPFFKRTPQEVALSVPTHLRRAGDEQVAASRTPTIAPAGGRTLSRSVIPLPEIRGTARLGKRTKELVKRLGPRDIAVIDHRNLDRMA